VDSVRTAVSLLGARRIQALAVLLAAQARSNAAPALAGLALTRARLCEELARQSGNGEPAVQFTVGLLSVMDAMLDLPMETVVAHLPLSETVAAALIDPMGPSPAAAYLRAVLLQERGSWEQLEQEGQNLSFLSRLYADVVGGNDLDMAA
jgi:EAL and modified HD-GYP domain-containing signal transduction protein